MLFHSSEEQFKCVDLCFNANAVDAEIGSAVMFHCDIMLQCVTERKYIGIH